MPHLRPDSSNTNDEKWAIAFPSTNGAKCPSWGSICSRAIVTASVTSFSNPETSMPRRLAESPGDATVLDNNEKPDAFHTFSDATTIDDANFVDLFAVMNSPLFSKKTQPTFNSDEIQKTRTKHRKFGQNTEKTDSNRLITSNPSTILTISSMTTSHADISHGSIIARHRPASDKIVRFQKCNTTRL